MKKTLQHLLAATALVATSLQATPSQATPYTAAAGFTILPNGVGVWTFPAGAHTFGVVAATEAEAVAIINASGTMGGNVIYVAGPSAGATGTAGGTVAGGSLLGTLGILAAAGVIALGATIAIDCYAHGECIWTTVNNAGGWGQVLGTSPPVNAQPIPGAVTVNCSDPTPLAQQCRNSSLRNVITSYSYFGAWTCGNIWDDGTQSASAAWNAALANCNAQVDLCVASTNNVCRANGIARADVQAVALQAVAVDAL